MITSLELIAAELKLEISTICHHLRNRSYAQNSQEIWSAMSSMILFQILVDELDNLLHGYHDVVNSLEKFLTGERYDSFSAEDQEAIYAYCLHRFEGEFALGSATPELIAWFSTYADRNQTIRRGFSAFFPDVEFKIADIDESGSVAFRLASEAEKFKSNTDDFLRDIEYSGALVAFNQRMQVVKGLLEQEAPVVDILSVLKSKEQ